MPRAGGTRVSIETDKELPTTSVEILNLVAHRPNASKLDFRRTVVERVYQTIQIPGLTIPLWWVPTVTSADMKTRTGNPEFVYEIACAQLCGLGHAKMRGFVTVHTPEEYQAWIDAEEAKLAEQGEGDAVWN